MYDATTLVIGPNVGLWWNVTLPGDNTKLVLDANGHPPDGVHLGYTDHGATLTIGWAAPAEEAWDNQEGYRVATANQMSIEGVLCQVADMGIMQSLLVPAYLTGGGSLFTFGTAKRIAGTGGINPSLVMVYKHQHWPATGLSDYAYAMIYSAVNTTPYSFAVTRRDLTRVPFRFDGRPIYTRTASDQIGQMTSYTP